ncbi:MAG: hypothetical protein ACYC6R_01095 [Anaerolineales bacterium]
MHINFAMWRKASWQLVKMDDKKEWDALDLVSKWLIATRSAVTLVTVYSCVIAGILAARDGYFSWLPFLIVTLGLFIAHGTNNILNDYTDYNRGVDKDNYFRTQYGYIPSFRNFGTTPPRFVGSWSAVCLRYRPVCMPSFIQTFRSRPSACLYSVPWYCSHTPTPSNIGDWAN